MSSTTYTAPIDHATRESTDGFSYAFGANAIRLAIEDSLDPVVGGMVALVGDLAGSGSDTLRNLGIDGVGFGKRFAALGGEADSITPSSVTALYDAVSVAPYGLAHSETWVSGVLQRPGTIDLDMLVGMVPASFLATLRYLACVTGAAMGTDIGTTTTTLSVDDVLDLIAAKENASAQASGMLTATIAPQQLAQLRESARSEPAFQFPDAFKMIQMGRPVPVIEDLLGVGIRCLVSTDVQQAASAYQGFAGTPGFLGWAKANPAQFAGKLLAQGHSQVAAVEEYGILISSPDFASGVRSYEARCLVGTALADSTLTFQRGFISQV